MNIYQSDGTQLQIPTLKIDSVGYSESIPLVMLIYLNNGQTLTIALSDIDSITHITPSQLNVPTLLTHPIQYISQINSLAKGEILYNGGAAVTSRGICWSTSPNPTIQDAFSNSPSSSNIFSTYLHFLAPNTKYYLRAFAINSVGVGYGNEILITTHGSGCNGLTTFTDSRDGKTYNLVEIGNQCWIAENMKFNTSNSKCYNNDESNCDIYGRLYSWSDAFFACPFDGWSLPSDEEWIELEMALGMTREEASAFGLRNDNEGSKLAGTESLWTSGALTINASFDESGFNAIPGGATSGYSAYLGSRSAWWSATPDPSNPYHSYARILSNDNSSIQRTTWYKPDFLSVRCVKHDYIPRVYTDTITSITQYSAASGGEVIEHITNIPITARGLCWSTSPNPTTADFKTIANLNFSDFVSYMEQLQPATTYYVRAYATNQNGTIYGNQRKFTTPRSSYCNGVSSYTDPRDGQVYGIAQIGKQCWMTDNLNYAAQNSLCYNNLSSNCDTYGRLYSQTSILQGSLPSIKNPSEVQGVCPPGWHIPSDDEWKELEIALGMPPNIAEGASSLGRGTNEGSKLAGHSELWNSGNLINNAAFASSGFSAKPGGARINSEYSSLGSRSYWWSSTENTIRQLRSSSSSIVRDTTVSSATAASCRCVKDNLDIKVHTNPIKGSTQTIATGGGTVIINSGNLPITARGVCWSTTPNPTTSNNHTIDGSGTGDFTSILNDLLPATTYYVRAYATYDSGTAYGNEVQYRAASGCNGSISMTDPRDGKVYAIEKIGDQCWMAENLNYNIDGSRCYNNDSLNCDKYGRLYDWHTLMNGSNSSNSNPSGVQGICPPGWHLPSESEWLQLSEYLGGVAIAGKKLKATSGWRLPNTGANNNSGFNGLPGGYFHVSSFINLGSIGYWWSTTEVSISNAVYMILRYNNIISQTSQSLKNISRSCRCIKD